MKPDAQGIKPAHLASMYGLCDCLAIFHASQGIRILEDTGPSSSALPLAITTRIGVDGVQIRWAALVRTGPAISHVDIPSMIVHWRRLVCIRPHCSWRLMRGVTPAQATWHSWLPKASHSSAPIRAISCPSTWRRAAGVFLCSVSILLVRLLTPISLSFLFQIDHVDALAKRHCSRTIRALSIGVRVFVTLPCIWPLHTATPPSCGACWSTARSFCHTTRPARRPCTAPPLRARPQQWVCLRTLLQLVP